MSNRRTYKFMNFFPIRRCYRDRSFNTNHFLYRFTYRLFSLLSSLFDTINYISPFCSQMIFSGYRAIFTIRIHIC